MLELDKDSFLNISEFINEEDIFEEEIKKKLNNDFENKSSNDNNKNEFEYIVRIKENNMLKRENEELKNRIKNLLKEKNELKEKIIISPS